MELGDSAEMIRSKTLLFLQRPLCDIFISSIHFFSNYFSALAMLRTNVQSYAKAVEYIAF